MTTRRRNPNNTNLLIIVWALVMLMSLTNHSSHRFDPLLSGLLAGLGCAVFLQVTSLWQAAFGRLTGRAVIEFSIGSGVRRLARWQVGGMPVSFRWFLATPLMMDTVLVRRPAQRLRLWLSTLMLSAVQLGLGLTLMMSVSAALGGGVLFLTVLSLTIGAIQPLTPGWVLFRLPFMPADALAPYALTPAELAATRAVRNGRLSEARMALEGSEPSFQTHLLRATIAIADGRYSDASAESRSAVETTPHAKAAAPAYFLRAAALVGAAENGELPPAEYLPWLDQAVAAGHTASAVLARMVSAAADLALLEGRQDEALKLARKAARQGLDPFWQAEGECTYAAALAANGRPDQARAALDRARKLMPELARIDTVATRIGLGEVTAGR